MKTVWKLEFRRLFHSKGLHFSLAVGVILVVWLFIQEIVSLHQFEEEYALYGNKVQGYLHYPKTLYNSFIGLEYDGLPPIILYTLFPLLVTLPYASSYFQDRKSGYVKNIFVRVDRKQYYTVKFAVVFFSGFFACGVILLLSLLLTMLVFPMLLPKCVTANYAIASENDMWYMLFYQHPMIYTLSYILLDMLFCGCMATLTLLINMVTNTIFFSLTGSFLIFETLDYLLQTIGLVQWSSLSFYLPTQRNGSAGLWVIVVEFLALFLISFVLFYWKERKKDVF